MSPFFLLALVIFCWVHFLFILSVLIKRNDVMDVGWGGGFVLAVLTLFFSASQVSKLFGLVVGLITIWGLRLAIHIGSRNFKKTEEDFRYKAWRKEWKTSFLWRSYLQIYLLQGVLLFVMLVPVAGLSIQPIQSTFVTMFMTIIGSLIWGFGFLCEAIADYQMTCFKNDSKNRGALIQTGLWRYSRHPNYFGELLVWWGLSLILCQQQKWGVAFISPLLITFLILYVSGIPLLEKKYAGRFDWEMYAQKTSRIILWPVKKNQ